MVKLRGGRGGSGCVAVEGRDGLYRGQYGINVQRMHEMHAHDDTEDVHDGT